MIWLHREKTLSAAAPLLWHTVHHSSHAKCFSTPCLWVCFGLGVLWSNSTDKAMISHLNVALNVFPTFAESYFKCNILFWYQCTQARSPLTQNATQLVLVAKIRWKWSGIVSEEGRNTATNYKRDSTPWPEKKTCLKTKIIYSPTCWGRRGRRGTGCLWRWGVGKLFEQWASCGKGFSINIPDMNTIQLLQVRHTLQPLSKVKFKSSLPISISWSLIINLLCVHLALQRQLLLTPNLSPAYPLLTS